MGGKKEKKKERSFPGYGRGDSVANDWGEKGAEKKGLEREQGKR